MWLFIYRPGLYPWAQGQCQLERTACRPAACVVTGGDLSRPADLSQLCGHSGASQPTANVACSPHTELATPFELWISTCTRRPFVYYVFQILA